MVGTAGPVADRQRCLAELLDREILPCLERPGRLLGPFDLPSATVTGSTNLALVWPSIAEGAHAPTALRPLLAGLPDPRPFSLNLGSVPSSNLAAALRAHGQPVFGRPDWVPLSEADLWVVFLDHPLQLTGLLTILDASGLAPHASARRSGPRVVLTGPAVERVGELARVYADAVLQWTDGIDAAAWHALAAAAEAPRDRLLQFLEPLGPVAGSLAASDELPSGVRADEPAGPARPAGPAPRADLGVGPPFLRRAPWRVEGRAPAWTDHVVVGAGSERLRSAIGLSDASTLAARIEESLGEEAASLCLHFVLGLDDETEADRLAIADFVNEVVDAAPRGVRQVSVVLHELSDPAAGVPRPDRLARDHAAPFARIRQRIRGRRMKVESAAPGLSVVEGLLSGGADQAPVLELAWRAGARHAESEAALDPGTWRTALEALGRGAPAAESGPEAAPVAAAAAATGLPPLRVSAPRSVSPDAPRTRRPRGRRARPDRWTRWRALVPQRFEYRIEYAKEGRLRFLGPAELGELLLGACERADIPVCTTGVVQPRPRIGYGPSLGAGIVGEHEVLDLSLERKVGDLRERLSTELPEEIRLLAVEFMPRCSPSMQLSRIALAEYEASVGGDVHDRSASRDEDVARVRRWNRRIEEGLSPEGEDPADPIRQLRAIHWQNVSEEEARLGFTLDLRAEGTRCKPREVVARALAGLCVDPRLIPLRRLRLLVVDDSAGRARLRTPLEQVLLARGRQRALERAWAE